MERSCLRRSQLCGQKVRNRKSPGSGATDHGSLQVSHEKRAPGWLGFLGDEILNSYIGIIINHSKDPY